MYRKRCGKYWTVTQAIDFVLENADSPLSPSEIVRKIPHCKIGHVVSGREFWRYWGRVLKRKKSMVVESVPCLDNKLQKQMCYQLKKDED